MTEDLLDFFKFHFNSFKCQKPHVATILGHLALDKAEGRKGPEVLPFPNIVQG